MYFTLAVAMLDLYYDWSKWLLGEVKYEPQPTFTLWEVNMAHISLKSSRKQGSVVNIYNYAQFTIQLATGDIVNIL